eukprot:1607068-Rhodomonas_salina.1
MRKGVCAAQPNHTFARQSTLFACLTRLPSGPGDCFFGAKPDILGFARAMALLQFSLSGLHFWFSAPLLALRARSLGTLVGLFLDDTFAGGLDLTFAGVLELTGTGLGWIHCGALTTVTGRDSQGTLTTSNCCGTVRSGGYMVTRSEKRALLESDSDTEAGASSRTDSHANTQAKQTVSGSPGEEEGMESDSGTKRMDSLAEGVQDTSLQSPEGDERRQGISNPGDTGEEQTEEKSRQEELAK